MKIIRNSITGFLYGAAAAVFVTIAPSGAVYCAPPAMHEINASNVEGTWYGSDEVYESRQAAGSAIETWLEQKYFLAHNEEDGTSRASGGYRFVLSEDHVNRLDQEEAFLTDWTWNMMPQIVSTGTDAETAIRNIYTWIIANREYDMNQRTASVLVQTGRGNCRAQSNLFLAMVRALPFDPVTWTVDYSLDDGRRSAYGADFRGSCARLKVRVVSEPIHSWNAVKIGDEWRYFDVTLEHAGETKYFNKTYDEFYDGKVINCIQGLEYVRTAIVPAE